MPNQQGSTQREFRCDCGGGVERISDTRIIHACANKYATPTSYYDGKPRFAPYNRVQISRELTGGTERYNWFASWA